MVECRGVSESESAASRRLGMTCLWLGLLLCVAVARGAFLDAAIPFKVVQVLPNADGWTVRGHRGILALSPDGHAVQW